MRETLQETLYYDGRCPLCTREVALLRRASDDRLAFCDIHEADAGTEGLPPREDLLQVLHIRREDGTLVTALDANVAAWQHTRYGLFWRWLRWPPMRWLAQPVYAAWARRRYRRLYGESAGG
jgi:predicted DCC family thiol-disulfide oxidoreductase YuxK